VPVGAVSVAIAPGSQDVVYAAAARQDESALALLRSDQGGSSGTWVVQNRGDGSAGSPDWLGYCDDPQNGIYNGGYVNALSVDPVDPDRLWLGGVDLFRSEDAGKTLTIASYWYLDPTDGTPYAHADQHRIVFDPGYDGAANRRVYFANDGGIFRTDDDRAPTPSQDCDQDTPLDQRNKVLYTSLNQGYAVAQFVGGSVEDSGGVYVGGTQDNGTVAVDSTGDDVGGGWVRIWSGDGGNSAIDSATGTLFVSNFNFNFYKNVQGLWYYANRGISDKGLFYPPLEMDPTDGTVLWTGGRRLWRTANAGNFWSTVTPNILSFSGVVTAIAVAPDDGNIVYAGLSDGELFKSIDAMADAPTWTPVGVGALPAAPIGAIAIDPTDHDVVFVGIKSFGERHLWRSDDGGQTWANHDDVLPDFPVGTIAVNPMNHSMVYVGTDMGVFESLDGGTTWHVANDNLATTIVSKLVFRKGTSELFAFTFGRGAYRVDVGSAAPPTNDELAAATVVGSAPFDDREGTRLATSGLDDPVVPCGATADPAQTRSVWYQLSGLAAGRYVLSTEGSNYDTVLAVFAPADVGGLEAVACDDDSVAAGGASRLELEVEAGGAYYVEVTLSSDASGQGLGGSLSFSVTPAG
jgi:hypothetical protein